jgi:hypothetical protein
MRESIISPGCGTRSQLKDYWIFMRRYPLKFSIQQLFLLFLCSIMITRSLIRRGNVSAMSNRLQRSSLAMPSTSQLPSSTVNAHSYSSNAHHKLASAPYRRNSYRLQYGYPYGLLSAVLAAGVSLALYGSSSSASSAEGKDDSHKEKLTNFYPAITAYDEGQSSPLVSLRPINR